MGEEVSPYEESLFALLVALIVVSAVSTGTAISGTVYTWEKTFEVKKPGIECEIEVGECRLVGCPVNVWACLRLEECGDCRRDCDYGWGDECNDDCRDRCEPCCCSANGTYGCVSTGGTKLMQTGSM